MTTESRAYATIVRLLEVLNQSGKYRAALVTASVKRYPEVVLHGNVDVVRGLACSNMLETTGIISEEHHTVTLPLLDYTDCIENGAMEDRMRAITDGLEAESRPRRNLFQREKGSATPPPFWPPTVSFSSLNSDNRKVHSDLVIRQMQEYKERRWEDIMEGRNLEKYNNTEQILADDEKKLSKKQRDARAKKRNETVDENEDEDMDRGGNEEVAIVKEGGGGMEEGDEEGGNGKENESSIPKKIVHAISTSPQPLTQQPAFLPSSQAQQTSVSVPVSRAPTPAVRVRAVQVSRSGHLLTAQRTAPSQAASSSNCTVSPSIPTASSQPATRERRFTAEKLAANNLAFRKRFGLSDDSSSAMAPPMSLGKAVIPEPPLKRHTETTQGDENREEQKTFKVVATLRDGTTKNLYVNKGTTVQAVIRQSGSAGNVSLRHEGHKVPYSLPLLGHPSVAEALNEGEDIVVDIR